MEQIYEFDELNKEAQQTAIENNRYWNVEHYEWWDNTYEIWQEDLAEFGYGDVKINFSGFSSQGDGASFTAGIGLRQWIKAMGLYNGYRALYYWLSDDLVGEWGYAKIERIYGSRHCHKFTIDSIVCAFAFEHDLCNCTDNSQAIDRVVAQLRDLRSVMIEHAREMSRKIYADLESEYDHLVSDEAVSESLRANSVAFLADGSVFHTA